MSLAVLLRAVLSRKSRRFFVVGASATDTHQFDPRALGHVQPIRHRPRAHSRPKII